MSRPAEEMNDLGVRARALKACRVHFGTGDFVDEGGFRASVSVRFVDLVSLLIPSVSVGLLVDGEKNLLLWLTVASISVVDALDILVKDCHVGTVGDGVPLDKGFLGVLGDCGRIERCGVQLIGRA